VESTYTQLEKSKVFPDKRDNRSLEEMAREATDLRNLFTVTVEKLAVV
jgi:hypothetical protein